MVTFRNQGRMGNFLFQAATAIAYAMKHGLEYTMPNKTHDPKWAPLYLQHLVNPNWDDSRHAILIEEKQHSYEELPFEENWIDRNIILNGYWQSEKYFKQYEDEIVRLFNFRYEENKGVVGLHKRMGDYRLYPTKHPIITDEYIAKAIDFFSDMGYVKFKIFSDEIDECKKTINSDAYPGCTFEYAEGGTEVSDMEDMSGCEHQIISNSTLALWAYLLNKNPDKICVAPEIWFGPDNAHLSVKDIYPEGAIKM